MTDFGKTDLYLAYSRLSVSSSSVDVYVQALRTSPIRSELTKRVPQAADFWSTSFRFQTAFDAPGRLPDPLRVQLTSS